MSEKALLQAETYSVTEQIERETDDAATGTNEQQKEADGVKIEGLAIPFNKRSRNGVVYETESLKETAETLVGCSILFNHDDDQPLGHVKDVEVTDEGIRYEGDLNPERRETESLKRGDIPNVSIQAMIEESKSDKADVAVTEFLELSAVTVPGYPSTTVDAEGVMVESFVDEEQSESIDSEEESETQTEAPDDITYEFEPIPKLVLYDNEADARQRAQDLGVEGIHQHDYDGETYWMAGQTHGQWRQLVGLQENLSKEEKLEKALEVKNNILGENMTEEQEEQTEDADEFTASQFYELVAEVHENLSKEDVEEIFEEFSFEGGVMEVFESLTEADDEEDDGDMPDEEETDEEKDGDYEEEEESESSNKKGDSQESNNDMSSKTREELENRIEKLEETIMELEETEPSKQEAANTPSKKNDSGLKASQELKNKFSR